VRCLVARDTARPHTHGPWGLGCKERLEDVAQSSSAGAMARGRYRLTAISMVFRTVERAPTISRDDRSDLLVPLKRVHFH